MKNSRLCRQFVRTAHEQNDFLKSRHRHDWGGHRGYQKNKMIFGESIFANDFRDMESFEKVILSESC